MDRDQLRRHVLEDLRTLSTADGAMNVAAAAALGIHPTDLHAGEVLDRQGPMTIGDLAKAVGLSPGAATALVDRLEEARLAVRRPDPTSRRRVLVQPSKQAAVRADAIFGPLVRRTTELLDSYRDHDLRLIHEFLVAARTIIVEHADLIRNERVAGSGTP